MAARKTPGAHVAAPDLPELEPTELAQASGELVLGGARVKACPERVCAARVVITESELRGVALEATRAIEFRLSDVIVRDCDLSTLEAEGAILTRVAISDSRLTGLSLTEGEARDVEITDSNLSLALFAFASLRDVSFLRVDLREASFMEARLENVSFIECRLEGADFRNARLKDCVMRGSSLDRVIGVESLRGLTMPWSDVISSIAALAEAAGIQIEDR